mmetsp:Transcript_19053/g.29227  ORF Transcript_19053/g.29227 Transcript_19053/m.29227 type:complete len:86 (+) Transcript_19053:254-511(+)
MKVAISASSASAPEGITSFINSMFGKQFKEHNDSAVDGGTVEMQYDFNCESTEFMVVADVHGLLSEQEMAPLGFIFDEVILHVSE